MYLLFCNLPVNDIVGNSIMLPRLLSDILRPPSERLISYYECVLQAFTVHIYGTTCHTILMIMAFDRYVAICNPLRYAAIMTSNMVVKLTVSAWGVAFTLVLISLLALTGVSWMLMRAGEDGTRRFEKWTNETDEETQRQI
ncbi:unnamed protein product [Pleuronectes platessa]|uniref:G-protein coupled receptors family 1 profile domain-containing protein n=1 Tax=Pleuronectes platessa TaxID=8262 RepID=A0A9N7UIY9_PLEPL|nr:unnamed protein product [Pleuronectes platessa]